jgi:hypothetical protein
MNNHVHLFVRYGLALISTAMQRLLTGYAIRRGEITPLRAYQKILRNHVHLNQKGGCKSPPFLLCD